MKGNLRKRLGSLVLAAALAAGLVTGAQAAPPANITRVDGGTLSLDSSAAYSGGQYVVTYTARLTISEQMVAVVNINRDDSEDLRKLRFTCYLEDELLANVMNQSLLNSAALNITASGNPIFEEVAGGRQVTVDGASVTYKLTENTITALKNATQAAEVGAILQVPMSMTMQSTVSKSEMLSAVGSTPTTVSTDGYIILTNSDGSAIPGYAEQQLLLVADTATMTIPAATSSGGGTSQPSSVVIIIEGGENGTVTPSGRISVDKGDDLTIQIKPDPGFQVKDILVDGKSVGPASEYTLKDVTAKHTIEVLFEEEDSKPGVADPDDTGVSAWLETEDHIQYLQGFPGNLFGPGDNITRAEVAQMFYNLLLDKNVPVTTAFSDVAADAWYATSVNVLASMGVLKGTGGDKFEPMRTITRAEFTTIAMRFAKLDTSGVNIFTDVKEGTWYYDYVVGSVKYGWINGYGDGTFRPENKITRAEVTIITNRMLGRSADQDYVDSHRASLKQFSDLATTNYAYYDIMEATNPHTYTKAGGSETWTGLK